MEVYYKFLFLSQKIVDWLFGLNTRVIMKNLLDVDDLAKYLKLQKQTIYNWLNQRKITGIKLGGVWRFDKQEIDKWLKSQARRARRNN